VRIGQPQRRYTGSGDSQRRNDLDWFMIGSVSEAEGQLTLDTCKLGFCNPTIYEKGILAHGWLRV
jgi:hypothetical protein